MTDNAKTPSGSSEKKNPHHALFDDLRPVRRELESLKISCNTLLRQARLLDQVSDQDADLDEELWHKVSNHPYAALMHPLTRASRDLTCALAAIDQSAAHISGLFEGEQKAQTEDRANAFRREGGELLKVFQQLLSEQRAARKPSIIRQQSLSIVLLTFAGINAPLLAFRQSVSRDQLADGMFDILTVQQAALDQLQLEFMALRDNPSQSMGDHLQSCLERIESAHAAIDQLIAQAMEECKRAGMHFYNRAGRVF